MPKRRDMDVPRRQRHRVSGELLLSLASHLTARDHQILAYLAEHQVLTTPQIRDLVFSSTRHTQRRLAELAALGVLSRVRPRASRGSAPTHWILGPAGVVVLAADQEVDVRVAGALRNKALTAALGQWRQHLVGVNGFFTRLVADDAGDLDVWWPEQRCARRWGRVVIPDGYGQWRQNGDEIAFWLEYDRGTERLVDLVDKVYGYAEIADTSWPAVETSHPWLLFRLPSARRERDLHRIVPQRTGVPIATAWEAGVPSPAAAIWRPLGASQRLTLIELAGVPAIRPYDRDDGVFR